MRLRQFLENSVKREAHNILIVASLLLWGCTSSTTPTYLKENIDTAIQDVCKKEYNIDVKTKLIINTLWIYLPVEDIFVALDKKDKPKKYLEKFLIEHSDESFEADTLKLEYLIKAIPEKERYEEYQYNKDVFEKINNVLSVLRRVLFSMDRAKASEPKFFCLIVADIKNGFELKEVFYYLDLKKVSYGFISSEEYQHRSVHDLNIVPQAIADKEGLYLDYKDITLKEFITDQIKQRIKLKFQKPEVDKNVDIDKEILKLVTHTLKTYDFKDFAAVELDNLLTQNKIILNRQAIWERSID